MNYKLTIILCFISVVASAQEPDQPVDAMFQRSTDTVDVNRNVIITPNGATRSLKSLPYYVVPAVDQRLREASMGMSVLNTLRGQVPGLYMLPQFVTTNPFDYSTLLVIDGVPVNSDMASFSNLNTFDYFSPKVTTGNASTYFGQYGSGNTVFLNSLNHGPGNGSFTFNTFDTWASFNGQDRTVSFLRLSNSLAYTRSFRNIDVRASGNYTVTPTFADDGTNGFVNRVSLRDLNFKLNTGWQSGKFRSRLILEKGSELTKTETRSLQPDRQTLEGGFGNARANLGLEYDAAPWLRLTSRLQKSWVNRKDQPYWQVPVENYKQDRNFLNLFASFDKNITSVFGINASTGIQRDRANGTVPYYINSQLNTLGFRFRDQLFVDGNYRIDKSDIHPGKNNRNTWSVASGWVFTDLWKRPELPFGKVRASVGRYSYLNMQYYPQVTPSSYYHLFPASQADVSKQYFRYEAGTDLEFLKNRLQLTFNYLRTDAFNRDSVTEVVQQSNVNITWKHLDRRRNYTDIQQLAIGAYLSKDKSVFTKFLITTTQTRTKLPPNKSKKTNEGQPYYISLLQVATFNGITLNALLEAYSAGHGIEAAGLRQFSICWPVAKSFAERRSVNPAQLSFIVRNLMGGNGDENVYTTNGMTKSISVGYTMTF